MFEFDNPDNTVEFIYTDNYTCTVIECKRRAFQENDTVKFAYHNWMPAAEIISPVIRK